MNLKNSHYYGKKGVLSTAEFERAKAKVLNGKESKEEPSDSTTPKEVNNKRMGGWAKALLWLGGAVIAFLIFGATVGNTPEAQERRHARDAISLCWKQQEKKSLTPGDQRFIAGACELMEADFRKKFGFNP
ncbi:hypothetical protein [Achromobacter pestifer]